MKQPFSELVSELVWVWTLWVKNNNIAKSDKHSIHERSKACDLCEDLIKREYEIVAMLDRFFNTDEQAGH